MNINQFHELRAKYNIDEIEMVCILTNIVLNNKVLSYSLTIGKNKKIKAMQQSATNFFKRVDIQKFIFEQIDFLIDEVRGASDIQEQKRNLRKETLKQNGTEQLHIPGENTELTKENIKQVLELELSRTRDPEKRASLLIRIADLFSLQENNSNDHERPVIYIPDRYKH